MRVSRSELIELLRIEREEQAQVMRERSIYIGFEYKPVDIIVPSEDGKWDLVEMEWGFIPNYWWTREIVSKNRSGYWDENGKWIAPSIPLLNAKGETLLTSKMFSGCSLKSSVSLPRH